MTTITFTNKTDFELLFEAEGMGDPFRGEIAPNAFVTFDIEGSALPMVSFMGKNNGYASEKLFLLMYTHPDYLMSYTLTDRRYGVTITPKTETIIRTTIALAPTGRDEMQS